MRSAIGGLAGRWAKETKVAASSLATPGSAGKTAGNLGKPAMAEMSLAGCRVFVVEDDMVIGMLIEDILGNARCTVIGLATTLAEALADAGSMEVDMALLDVGLGDEQVYPVAEILESRGIPFLLLSGYGADAVPPERQHWPWCTKPYRAETLNVHMRAWMVRT